MADAPPCVLVTGADTALGSAVVAAASGPVLAGGADHAALARLASDAVVPLTLGRATAAELRVVAAVAADRFGGVGGVVHLAGFGGSPDAPADLGARVGHAAATHAALPDVRHVIVVEEGGRGDPAAPLRAAAAAALEAWARSVRAEVVVVPAGAHPPAWADVVLGALTPAVGARVRRGLARLRRRAPR